MRLTRSTHHCGTSGGCVGVILPFDLVVVVVAGTAGCSARRDTFLDDAAAVFVAVLGAAAHGEL